MGNIHKLYNGQVVLSFSEAGHRYKVVERQGKGWTEPRKVVGVSTVLGMLNKPSLLTWPMTEALKHLGATLKFEDEKFVWYVQGEKTLTEETVREAAKAYLKKSDVGKDTGKEIHKWVEQFLEIKLGKRTHFDLEGFDPELNQQLNKATKNFKEWFEKHKDIEILEVEKVLYSKSLEYAGTCDALLKINDSVVLVDWKTNNISRDAPQGVYPEAIIQMGAYSLAYREETGKPVDDTMVVNISKRDSQIRSLRASELGLSVTECEDAFRHLLNVYKFHNKTSNFIKKRS